MTEWEGYCECSDDIEMVWGGCCDGVGKVLMVWGGYCDSVERFYWCEKGIVMMW